MKLLKLCNAVIDRLCINGERLVVISMTKNPRSSKTIKNNKRDLRIPKVPSHLLKINGVIEELLVVVGWLAMPQRLSTVV
jgi:hypothetical protein